MKMQVIIHTTRERRGSAALPGSVAAVAAPSWLAPGGSGAGRGAPLRPTFGGRRAGAMRSPLLADVATVLAEALLARSAAEPDCFDD